MFYGGKTPNFKSDNRRVERKRKTTNEERDPEPKRVMCATSPIPAEGERRKGPPRRRIMVSN